ncbi:MAG TPA: Hint domain-containing homing endonuclease [Archangium sp.]|nr:Hint domain-containing homing endonuclease [Archangium sp.]
MKPTRPSKKHLFLVPHLALASVAIAGTATAAAPAAAPKKSEAPAKGVLMADATRMTRLFNKTMDARPSEQRHYSMRLDLGDEAQYQFVLHRILAAGNTPENSPRLFQSLEKARELARAGVAPASTKECSQLITLEESPLPGTMLFQSAAMVSCFGNDGYLFSDLTAFQAGEDSTNQALLDRRSREEYGTHVGGSERASLDVMYRYEKNKVLQLDSLALGFDAETGAALATYATVATAGMRSTLNGALPTTTFIHPRDLINAAGEQVLRLCLQRGGYAGTNIDCDYATVVQSGGLQLYPLNGDYVNSPPPTGIAAVDVAQSQNTQVWAANGASYFVPPTAYSVANTYVPLQGVYSATSDDAGNQCTITSYNPTFNKATLYMVQADPTQCNYVNGQVIGTPQTLDGSGQVINANSSPFSKLLNFGPICVGYEKTVKLVVQIGARANCGPNLNVARYTTSTISPIQFRNSCFGEGTQVTLADGSTQNIEKVKVGDQVVANDKGLVLTVTTLSRGVESSPMVRIKDDQGHEALVTQTHPVMTANRGAVIAQELRVNDQLVTTKGTSTLTTVTREMYKGTVYNLALGTSEELQKAGLENGMLFAGGFQMGDYRMQNAMDAKRAKPAITQASIPQKWAVDYVNDTRN